MTFIRSTSSDFELFAQYRATGDDALRDLLVDRYEWLALRCAARFRNGNDPDVDQVARIGLVLAVSRFDPDRGFRFTTFARPTINGELKRHLRDTAWSWSVPRRLKDLRSPWIAATEKLTQELTRTPTTAELARELGTTPDVVADLERAGRSMVSHSLDHPLAAAPVAVESGDRTDGFGNTGNEVGMLIRAAIGGLDDRDRRIVLWYFYEDRTQGEIAERLGISQAQVSRLLSRTMAQLEPRLTPVVGAGHFNMSSDSLCDRVA